MSYRYTLPYIAGHEIADVSFTDVECVILLDDGRRIRITLDMFQRNGEFDAKLHVDVADTPDRPPLPL